MNTAILQHYVPQFLLRNFKSNHSLKKSEAKFYVYDKLNEKDFYAPISKTGGERYFYELKTENEEFSIEEKLGVFESATAPIIKKIIDNKSLKSLTRREKSILSKFIALQYLRGPAIRNRLNALAELLEIKFNFFEETGFTKPTEDENKRNHCELVLEGVHKLSPYLYNKDWVLCESKSSSLIIGDNPVVMNNTFSNGTGLKNECVEIYLPISPKYSLLILCGTVRRIINESLSHKITNPLAKQHIKNLKEYSQTFKNKGTIYMNAENVKFLNSLQITHSERFIYSQESNFDLAKSMISQDEKLKTGTGRFNVEIV